MAYKKGIFMSRNPYISIPKDTLLMGMIADKL